jgi:hypothetical protein
MWEKKKKRYTNILFLLHMFSHLFTSMHIIHSKTTHIISIQIYIHNLHNVFKNQKTENAPDRNQIVAWAPCKCQLKGYMSGGKVSKLSMFISV